ncbi:EAL domain-containing protein [Zooshikella harenae]|uniref:EAL domain-containing protein n=1 Tax=Zooshikella harenae TaxID=2827238 RepID=A0ABS5Z9S9_9GAMM|nr:EAL domain-containing protein [Zooshikella harenae]MBU2710807.1 EAL domain-containing protein [Zooshikella harenae]
MSPLIYQGFTLSSSFQPIINIRHQQVIGYEAFIRSKPPSNHQQSKANPAALFSLATRLDQLVLLDQLCRISHCQSFSAQDLSGNWLFFKQTEALARQDFSHSYLLDHLLKQSLLSPCQLIIELSEKAFKDKGLLKEVANTYKAIGLLVALDDIELSKTTAYHIESIRPDIIKCDLRDLHRTENQHHTSHLFTKLVAVANEVGCLSVIRAVETEKQAVLALSSGIDLLQGNLFSLPSSSLYAGSTTLHQHIQQLQQYIL